ncbi:hypothetical protein [Ruegeria sp. HKCCA6707]|uniref:hypothetical protein n=1 Tax=Ruegeria sp. HKCCA6707 TaxID=2682996 RepID=UPI0014883560|nr:hypothetical protein [Ruegeria sp. HKCCA6707]
MSHENRNKHLDFIMASISRMAQNSFLARGWCVTLTSALLAVLSRLEEPPTYTLVLVPIVLFWVVDAYYLKLEREFRGLYDIVRLLPEGEIDFSMNARQAQGNVSIANTLFSGILVFIYGGLILLVVFFIFFLEK